MHTKQKAASRIVDMAMIAALGSGTVTQELVGAVLSDIENVEPDLVVEETLCLVSATGARALEFGLDGDTGMCNAMVSGLLELPFIYRDYLLGRAVLDGSAERGDALAEQIAARLARKMDFYAAHLPAGAFPSERKINDVMELWMGRISPPRLQEMPVGRLKRLNLAERLQTHIKLLLAYAQR